VIEATLFQHIFAKERRKKGEKKKHPKVSPEWAGILLDDLHGEGEKRKSKPTTPLPPFTRKKKKGGGIHADREDPSASGSLHDWRGKKKGRGGRGGGYQKSPASELEFVNC